MIVGVIGSDGEIDEEQRTDAERVGRMIAERGAVLVCGGRGGVMEAACKGAKSAGGLTIGVLPTLDKSAANSYVDVPVVTGMDVARNVIIVRTADVLIAVGGRFGTLSEIGHALSMGKRVVSLHSWERLRSEQEGSGLVFASTPEEAVELAFSN
ncbi:MAG: TIGR00725 family protein [Methanomassiliicoccales archaeon]|nr:MAG: TIGR00725 family protein [Methanomassiliicoccales archaeon]